ncbi:hypothetical protein ACQKF0_26010 [Bacillus wiedmannii]|uniref:hypothetical protein n=1 Tax=Bacillus wiedmannii TaxID=1890302 RepID=UPI003D058FF1
MRKCFFEKYIPVIYAEATGIITAGATLTAVLLTQKGNKEIQKGLFKQQLLKDERSEKRNEIKECLEVYNKMLNLDGEFTMIIHVGRAIVAFELEIYQNEFRTIIYEKYHLIHNDVAKIVSGIDNYIKRRAFYGETTGDDHRVLCDEYTMLIGNMMVNIYEFSKGIED